eukprot:CAMPEP_0177705446 /NCGR_PEP_ID=MMETSP0484_2-20121128/8712_1 /TAXON_ID=354590 /ORGANISM="Rhodomonas lens, Strain RHODO" /LENGTH=311 /DNA_ID=CAMNT_0019216873 /DNA_START=296 /DNA_END=1231 /DNA_ORIENTATION=+
MYTIKSKTLFVGAICLLLAATVSAQDEPECKTFKEIYGTAKIMAEEMWNGAFTYETNEALAFDMWFVGANPNDAKAAVVNNSLSAGDKYMYDTNICHLNYFHKENVEIELPEHEPETFRECLPWAERACCASDTVETADKLKEGYGEEFHWDRCGPLSRACEAFFVQEACFYECEPTAGLYRKYQKHEFDPNNPDHNEWQMYGMPIKASYWDAWFAACANEKFCAHDGGDFFSCAAKYELADAADGGSSKLGAGAIAGIAVACVFGVAASAFALFMYRRERAGEPVFQPLNRDQARTGAAGQETQYSAEQP